MPLIEAHLIEGYAPKDKARLSRALTDAVRSVVPAPDEAITVLTHEYAADNYARGGVTRSPAPALCDPVALVQTYLTAMEARDLPAASACLGDDFAMVFPGTDPMTSLKDLLDWAAGRYRFVTKTISGAETCFADGVSVVYIRGTLAGEWPDGAAFSDVRFVDRFEVAENKIRHQTVWNDLAEVRP